MKTEWMGKRIKRIISVLTMGFFLASQVAFANPGAGIEIAVSREMPSFLRIDIPSELATLDGLYEAPPRQDPKLILHIQNAHANYGAQQKIKELLRYLENHYAMKTIFVEGASEDLNPDYLKMFPDRERNLKLAEFLAKQGELTGAELYLLEADSRTTNHGPRSPATDIPGPRPMVHGPKGYGIEDAGLYRENYDALKKVFGSEVTVKRYLEGFEGRLSTLASKVFSKDLLKLLGEWKKFEGGHREFMPYVKSLAGESKRVLGIDLESLLSQIEWPQITRLLVLQTMEKELDRQKGLAERDQLIQFLKEKRVSAKLITAIENFRDQQVTVLQGTQGGAAASVQPRDLMEQLVTEAGPKGFYFYNYPHFSLYAGYLILKSEMDPKGLFGEIRVLFTRILDQLAVGQHEKRLLELYRNEELIRKLLNLELTRKDWQEVLAKKDLLAMDPLVAELKEIGTAVSRKSGLPLSNFEMKPVHPKFREEVLEVQTAAYGFYEAARKREDVFYEKIDSVMRKESLSKAVLITGGFHTDGITELLREHEISYGILTPRLSEKSDENLYRNVMLQNKPGTFELSYLEAVSRLESFRVQRQQLGEAEVLLNLKPVLKAISYAGDFGDVKGAVDIFNRSVYAVNAGIHIDPIKMGEKDGKPVYQVTRRPEQRGEQPVPGRVISPPVDKSKSRQETRTETPEVPFEIRSEVREMGAFKKVVAAVLIAGMAYVAPAVARELSVAESLPITKGQLRKQREQEKNIKRHLDSQLDFYDHDQEGKRGGTHGDNPDYVSGPDFLPEFRLGAVVGDPHKTPKAMIRTLAPPNHNMERFSNQSALLDFEKSDLKVEPRNLNVDLQMQSRIRQMLSEKFIDDKTFVLITHGHFIAGVAPFATATDGSGRYRFDVAVYFPNGQWSQKSNQGELVLNQGLQLWSETLGQVRSERAKTGQGEAKGQVVAIYGHRNRADLNHSLSGTAAIDPSKLFGSPEQFSEYLKRNHLDKVVIITEEPTIKPDLFYEIPLERLKEGDFGGVNEDVYGYMKNLREIVPVQVVGGDMRPPTSLLTLQQAEEDVRRLRASGAISHEEAARLDRQIRAIREALREANAMRKDTMPEEAPVFQYQATSEIEAFIGDAYNAATKQYVGKDYSMALNRGQERYLVTKEIGEFGEQIRKTVFSDGGKSSRKMTDEEWRWFLAEAEKQSSSNPKLREVLLNLKPILKTISYAGDFGDVKGAVDISNRSVHTLNAGIRIDPVKMGEKDGKPVYPVTRRSEVRKVGGIGVPAITPIEKIRKSMMRLSSRQEAEGKATDKRKPRSTSGQVNLSPVAWVASRIPEIVKRFYLGIDTAADGLVMNEQGNFGKSEGQAAWVVVPGASLPDQMLADIFQNRVSPGGILVVAYPPGEVLAISGIETVPPAEEAATEIEFFGAGKLEDHDIHYVIIRKSRFVFVQADEVKRSEVRGDQPAASSVSQSGPATQSDAKIRETNESFQRSRAGVIEGRGYFLSAMTTEDELARRKTGISSGKSGRNILEWWLERVDSVFGQARLMNPGLKKKDFSILEVGSGDGLLAWQLASRGYRVTGMDFMAEFVKSANQSNPYPGNLQFVQGDATNLNGYEGYTGIPDSSVDLIISNELLGSVPIFEAQAREKAGSDHREVRPVFEEFFRKLRPGSLYMMNDYDEKKGPDGVGVTTQDSLGYINYSIADRKAALQAAGFQDIQAKRIKTALPENARASFTLALMAVKPALIAPKPEAPAAPPVAQRSEMRTASAVNTIVERMETSRVFSDEQGRSFAGVPGVDNKISWLGLTDHIRVIFEDREPGNRAIKVTESGNDLDKVYTYQLPRDLTIAEAFQWMAMIRKLPFSNGQEILPELAASFTKVAIWMAKQSLGKDILPTTEAMITGFYGIGLAFGQGTWEVAVPTIQEIIGQFSHEAVQEEEEKVFNWLGLTDDQAGKFKALFKEEQISPSGMPPDILGIVLNHALQIAAETVRLELKALTYFRGGRLFGAHLEQEGGRMSGVMTKIRAMIQKKVDGGDPKRILRVQEKAIRTLVDRISKFPGWVQPKGQEYLEASPQHGRLTGYINCLGRTALLAMYLEELQRDGLLGGVEIMSARSPNHIKLFVKLGGEYYWADAAVREPVGRGWEWIPFFFYKIGSFILGGLHFFLSMAGISFLDRFTSPQFYMTTSAGKPEPFFVDGFRLSPSKTGILHGFLDHVGFTLYDQGNALRVQGNIPQVKVKFAEAVDAYREALRIDLNNGASHGNLGVALKAQGKFDEAIGEFRKALRIAPNDADIHSNLGSTLYTQGNVLQTHGNASQAQGKFDEAIAEFRKALRIAPNNAVFHGNLGEALQVQGKFDEAIVEFRVALRIDPSKVLFHNKLGLALYAQGEFDEAITAYRRALRIHPNDASTHNNLGDALYAQGRAVRTQGNDSQARRKFGEAAAAFRKASSIDPKHSSARRNLASALWAQGNVFQAKGKFKEAIAEFREALLINPDDIFTHSGLGASLRAQGEFDEAIVEFQKALRIDPNDAFTHYSVGAALYAQGRAAQAQGNDSQARLKFDEAIAAYREALRIDPQHVPAREDLDAAIKESTKGKPRSEVRTGAMMQEVAAEAKDPWGTLEEGEMRRMELLKKFRKVSDLHKYIFYIGDLDKMGATNLTFSKDIVGVLGAPESPNLLFPPKDQPYFDVREVWKKILREEDGAEVYKYVGGDEYTIVSDEILDMSRANKKLTKAFTGRISSLRVTRARALFAWEIESLWKNPFVKSVAHYGTGIIIRVDRERLNEEGQWIDFLRWIDAELHLEGEDLFETQIETKDRGFFSTSTGAVTGNVVLAYLSRVMKNVKHEDGGNYWTRMDPADGVILREDRMELFNLWQMRFSNDALSHAKETGRNKAVIVKKPKDLAAVIRTAATPEQVLADEREIEHRKNQLDQSAPKNRDPLTGFLTTLGLRVESIEDENNIKEMVEISIPDYGNGSERAFHNIQSEKGYKTGNEIIQRVSTMIRSLLELPLDATPEEMKEGGILVGRKPPEKFLITTLGTEKNRGPPLSLSTQELDWQARELKEDLIGFGVRTGGVPRIAAHVVETEKMEQLESMDGLNQQFFKINEIMGWAEWFFDAMKAVSIERLEAAVDVEWGKHSYILRFNPHKANSLLELYREAEDMAREKALNELGGRDVPFRELVAEKHGLYFVDQGRRNFLLGALGLSLGVMTAQKVTVDRWSSEGTREFDPKKYELRVIEKKDIKRLRSEGWTYVSNAGPFAKISGEALGWFRLREDASERRFRGYASAMMKGIFLLNRNGEVRIRPAEGFDPKHYPKEQWVQGFQAGPMAITNGELNLKIKTWHRGIFSGRKNIIGVDRDGKVHTRDIFGWDIFGWTGPTPSKLMQELEIWKKTYGIKDALFVDGGDTGDRLTQQTPATALMALPRSETRDQASPGAAARSEMRTPAEGPADRMIPAMMTLENAIGDLKGKGGSFYEHSVRVQDLSRLIAAQLGLSAKEIEILSSAAILHDLGKIGVLDNILHKPGPLDPREQERMDHYWETGAAWVPEIPHRREVEQIIRMYHSETADLLTNIVGAVDYFDARTSKLFSNEPLAPDVVIAALRKEVPYINSKVVNALETLFEDSVSKARSKMRGDVLGYLTVSVKKRQILSDEKANEIASWLLSPLSGGSLRMDLIQQTLDYIFEIRAFAKTSYEELSKLLSRKFRETMGVEEKQAAAMFWWMRNKGEIKVLRSVPWIVPREVSPGVFEDFIKTFGKYYQADRKPRTGFHYRLPEDLDSETKLILATQNMKKMEEMFSPEFRRQESVLVARIPGTPYLLRMSYGFGGGSSGVYIVVEEIKGTKAQGVYRIRVDTQQTENGEALRVVWISGFPKQKEQIQKIFPERIGFHPGLALFCVALGLAQQKGFAVLSGIKGDKYKIQEHVLEANPGALYDRFKMNKGKGANEYARWKKVSDLLNAWASESPKVKTSWAEGARKMFAALKDLEEVSLDKLEDFVERKFADQIPEGAPGKEKHFEVRLPASGGGVEVEPIAELGGRVGVNKTTGRIQFVGDEPAVKPQFTLIGVRHGTTFANEFNARLPVAERDKRGNFQGQVDEPENQLTPDGRRSAEAAAETLVAQLQDKIDIQEEIILIVSPKGRAMETADAFIQMFRTAGGKINVIEDKKIRAGADEIDFGFCDNKTPEEITDPGSRAFVERYRNGLDATAHPGPVIAANGAVLKKGESFLDLLIRVKKWMDELNGMFRGRTVVVFGHGTQMGALRVLLGEKGLTDDTGFINWRRARLPNAKPVLLPQYSPLEELRIRSVRFEDAPTDLRTKQFGNKGENLAEMKRAGLPVPDGVVIPSEEVGVLMTDPRRWVVLTEEQKKRALPFATYVRSAPPVSMPGLMKTVSNVATLGQFQEAVRQVADSWNSEAAKTYRRQNHIPEDVYPAIVIQRAVDGTRTKDTSGSGVFFTRDPNTGEKVLKGRFAWGRPGDDVVKSIPGYTPDPLESLFERSPDLQKEMEKIVMELEKLFHSVQEVEFVVENGKLWILQSRNAKLTDTAKARAALDRVHENMIGKGASAPAIVEVQGPALEHQLYRFKEGLNYKILAQGIAASPGAVSGKVTGDLARAQAEHSIYYAQEPSDDLIIALIERKIAGLITAYGHEMTHEAIMARGAVIPAVAGIKNGDFPEDQPVILDGDTGRILTTLDENPFVKGHRATNQALGINVSKIKKEGEELHRDADLISLIETHAMFAKRSRGTTQEGLTLSLQAHVIHNLILARGKELGFEARILQDSVRAALGALGQNRQERTKLVLQSLFRSKAEISAEKAAKSVAVFSPKYQREVILLKKENGSPGFQVVDAETRLELNPSDVHPFGELKGDSAEYVVSFGRLSKITEVGGFPSDKSLVGTILEGSEEAFGAATARAHQFARQVEGSMEITRAIGWDDTHGPAESKDAMVRVKYSGEVPGTRRSEVRGAEALEEKAGEIVLEVEKNINRVGLDFLFRIHFSDVKLADADRVTDVATKISMLVCGILALNRTDPAEAARQMTTLANALGAEAMQAVLTALPEHSQIPATSEEGKIILLVTRESYQKGLAMVKIMLALNSGVAYKFGVPDHDPELAILMMKDITEWGGALKANGIDVRLGKRFEALTARDLERQAVKTTTAVAVRQSEMGVFGKALNVLGVRVKPVIFDYDARINGNDAAAHSGLIRYAQKINKNSYKSLSYLDEDLKAGELLKDIPFRLDVFGNLKATNGSLEHVLAQIVQDLQAIMQTAIAA